MDTSIREKDEQTPAPAPAPAPQTTEEQAQEQMTNEGGAQAPAQDEEQAMRDRCNNIPPNPPGQDETADVLDAEEELIADLDAGKETLQAGEDAQATGQSEEVPDSQKKVEYEVYDHRDYFEKEIAPLLDEVVKKCEALKIPYVISIQPIGDGKGGFIGQRMMDQFGVERASDKHVVAVAALEEGLPGAVHAAMQLMGGRRADDLWLVSLADKVRMVEKAHDRFCPKHGSFKPRRPATSRHSSGRKIIGGLIAAALLSELFGGEPDSKAAG